jgi:uncharacterized iron-regulated protein
MNGQCIMYAIITFQFSLYDQMPVSNKHTPLEFNSTQLSLIKALENHRRGYSLNQNCIGIDLQPYFNGIYGFF